MPAKFCDDRPCTLLQKAIDSFLIPREDGTAFEMDVQLYKLVDLKHVLTRVTLIYCPFCGTSIDPKFVEERVRPANLRFHKR